VVEGIKSWWEENTNQSDAAVLAEGKHSHNQSNAAVLSEGNKFTH
jgi:hypothetical protein